MVLIEPLTNEQLTRALNAQTDKLTPRICCILGGLLTLGFASIGLAIAFT